MLDSAPWRPPRPQAEGRQRPLVGTCRAYGAGAAGGRSRGGAARWRRAECDRGAPRARSVPGPVRAMVTEQEVEAIGRTLVDAAQPLPARFRALFTLRNLGGRAAVEWISRAFGDGSALLKHELAYCLGQMQDEAAIPVLIRVLEDTAQEPMVRHEAGEALGAIGNPDVLDILKRYSQDPVVEVAETCQLAVRRLEWLQNNKERPGSSPYLSVDPAPPAEETDVAKLREILLDESQELFERYRAMFALRNVGGQAAVLALAEAFRWGLHPGILVDSGASRLTVPSPQGCAAAARCSATRSGTCWGSCRTRRASLS
ncbi:deoxyhypusine hydroxylase isoform X2 [Passer domesticus]|uniref:deoxyhypusine hydroxylase isoform X2 n=1 Tax=Passer domesticus TaxID=48849 RepID=UPI0030FECDE4